MEDGRRVSELLLTAGIRQAVDHWRQDGCPGASRARLRLLGYWLDEDHVLSGGKIPRFYYGRREAVWPVASAPRSLTAALCLSTAHSYARTHSR